MTQKDDALDVLGAEAQPLIDELEAATTKAQPDGTVIKAEGESGESAAEAPTEEAPPKLITLEQLQNILAQLFESFKSNLDDRLGPVEAAMGDIAAIKARVDALGATESEKVKAAVDSGGMWWNELVKASVQRREPVKAGPEEKQAAQSSEDPFYRVFGGIAQH